jgi:uncharacterized membrane protein
MILIAFYAASYLNIWLLESCLAVIILGILPGLLIINLLTNNISCMEKIIMGFGVSQVFLMIYFFVINQFLLYYGYQDSLKNNIIVDYIIVAICFLIVINMAFKKSLINWDKIDISKKEIVLIIIALCIAILNVCGVLIERYANNNFMVMLSLLLIALFAIMIVALESKVSPKIFQVIIWLIGLPIVLMWGLRFSHVVGIDAHHEYYIMNFISNLHHWKIIDYSDLDACLSISILPNIYKPFFNITSEMFYKLFYPIIFSITPVIIYYISKNYVKPILAFMASLLFISYSGYQLTSLNARTNTAVMFFIYFIFVACHKYLKPVTKKILLLIFSLGVIISHYSTLYIFLMMLLIYYIIDSLYACINKKRDATYSILSIFTFLIVITTSFIWYAYVIQTPFSSGVKFIVASVVSLKDFFILESRQTVPGALGVGIKPEFMYYLEFITYWLILILITIGVLLAAVASVFSNKFCQKQFLGKINLIINERNIILWGLSSLVILLISVAFPFVTVGYDLNRILLELLPILATFFIIGVISIAKILSNRVAEKWLCVAILTVYFLSETSFTYQLVGIPRSAILNSQGAVYDYYQIYERDSQASAWLGKNYYDDKLVYCDFPTSIFLQSQGMIPFAKTRNIIAIENDRNYIFCRTYNTSKKEFMSQNQIKYVLPYLINNELQKQSIIYVNNGVVIYY